jgi:hypothetical protein
MNVTETIRTFLEFFGDRGHQPGTTCWSGNHSREPPVHPPWYGKGISGPRQHPLTMRERCAPTPW